MVRCSCSAFHQASSADNVGRDSVRLFISQAPSSFLTILNCGDVSIGLLLKIFVSTKLPVDLSSNRSAQSALGVRSKSIADR